MLPWLQIVVGAWALIGAARRFRRLRTASIPWAPDPWVSVALGGYLLLSGVAALTGPSVLSHVAYGVSIVAAGAALVLIYRQDRHLKDLEAKRKP